MNIGEKNKNDQVLLLKTDTKRTNHPFAKIWVVQCDKCGNKYGCNSCDAHIRKCPSCDKSAATAEPI